MAFKTFMSDDGRVILHADENFKLPGEVSIDGASPVSFDPSLLVAVGEHYFDRALWLALDEVKFMIGDLHKLGEEELKAKVAELGSNIKHLHELRRGKQEQPVFKLRCTGCGMAYDPPLMNGFICAECSSVWNSVDEKWALSGAAILARQSAGGANVLPKDARPSVGAQEALDREQSILTDAYKTEKGEHPKEGSELDFQGRKFFLKDGAWISASERAIEEVRQVEMATEFKSRIGRDPEKRDRFQYERRMYDYNGTEFVEEE